MLTQLHAKHFKSWGDTGPVRLAPLTGYFGTNSSGKSALLQILLLQKQTIESSDRHRLLHTGANDPRAYVDLGTPTAIAHQGNTAIPLEFAITWTPPPAFQLPDPNNPDVTLAIDQLQFSTKIRLHPPIPSLQAFTYQFPYRDRDAIVGLQHIEMPEEKHRLIAEGFRPQILLKLNDDQDIGLHLNYSLDPGNHHSFWLTPAVKYYGFSSDLQSYLTYLNDLVTAYERQFDRIYYLGPLREYPQRLYLWSGERPSDVGRRGELAIATLLAARGNTPNDPSPLELAIGHWLQQLDLIHSFRVSAIAPGRQEYELLVRRTATSTEVPITDVGFGISQILPVLTLCYSVPPGSTLLLEQPEIHLHPAVQAGLADIFIDAIQTRHIQIIVESHSEHLLRRLQRRIAERSQNFQEIDAALYFCHLDNDGRSQLLPLELDPYGNINNWPDHFFGDEMGDLMAMTEAAARRQLDP